MAQKCGNCQRNCIANKIHPPAFENSFPFAMIVPNGLIILVAATHPIKQGNAPGKAPTSTAIEFTFLSGVYTNAYKKRLNADSIAAEMLKMTYIIKTPTNPPINANT